MLSSIFGPEREAALGGFRMLNNEEVADTQPHLSLDDQVMEAEIRGCM